MKKIYYGTILDNIDIYLVDGDYIRDELDIDFSLGGHHLVYSCIPEDEIWVEILPNKKDILMTAIHEAYELSIMKLGKLDYNQAHEYSNLIEQLVRDKLKDLSNNGFEKLVFDKMKNMEY